MVNDRPLVTNYHGSACEKGVSQLCHHSVWQGIASLSDDQLDECRERLFEADEDPCDAHAVVAPAAHVPSISSLAWMSARRQQHRP